RHDFFRGDVCRRGVCRPPYLPTLATIRRRFPITGRAKQTWRPVSWTDLSLLLDYSSCVSFLFSGGLRLTVSVFSIGERREGLFERTHLLSPPAWPKPLRRGEGPALSSVGRRGGSFLGFGRAALGQTHATDRLFAIGTGGEKC